MKRLACLSRRLNLPALTTSRLWWLCWYVEILWEPHDCWIGLYWRRPKQHDCDVELFICLLPCLPLRIHVWDDSDVPF